MAKFYVVWRGRKVGIFQTWGETEALVMGFSGARFKSFDNPHLAQVEFERPAGTSEG